IEDRNGNLMPINWGNAETVTDDLGRTVSIGPTAYLQYPGQDGSVRNVQVYGDSLQNVLIPGEHITDMGDLFCGTAGCGGGWGCYQYTNCGNSTLYNNPSVISQILLPNGQSYRFCYDHYGDLARVFLPTGGSLEYD